MCPGVDGARQAAARCATVPAQLSHGSTPSTLSFHLESAAWGLLRFGEQCNFSPYPTLAKNLFSFSWVWFSLMICKVFLHQQQCQWYFSGIDIASDNKTKEWCSECVEFSEVSNKMDYILPSFHLSLERLSRHSVSLHTLRKLSIRYWIECFSDRVVLVLFGIEYSTIHQSRSW